MNSKITILVADDDRSIRTIISQTLERAGFDVIAVDNAASLWARIEKGEGELVISDVIMPDANGLDLIPRIKKLRPKLPIIVISAQNTLSTAVKATEVGAFEYLPKPFDINELTETVNKALKSSSDLDTNLSIKQNDDSPLIGRSPAMQDVYRTMARLMGTDLTVLIHGESGTGKELVAKALHDMGKRGQGPFIAVNMAAIPKNLIESELFGHEKGAFTGAAQRATGRFEDAKGGTLFLDEIGDMPFEAQTRLLRVLQQGEYKTIGGKVALKVKARIIAASNKNLENLVRQGEFREDLFYRLNVVPITVPPLRKRKEDIPDLVNHFSARAQFDGLPPKKYTEKCYEILKKHQWPGNVRELENLIRRLSALYTQKTIDEKIVQTELQKSSKSTNTGNDNTNPEGLNKVIKDHLQSYFEAHSGSLPPAGLYSRFLKEIERPLFEVCLDATFGNQVKTADLLGLNRNTLRKKLNELSIDPSKRR